jgi:hypothetical protein
MSARSTTKLIARNVVAFSTSFVIGNVLQSNATPKSKAQKAEVWIGSVACGMIAADVASSKTDRFVDSLFDILEGKTEPPIVVTVK